MKIETKMVPKIRQRSLLLRILSIVAILYCLISLLLPWLRFEVRTDKGIIDLNSIVIQDTGMSFEDMIADMQGEMGEIGEYIGNVKIVKQLTSIESAATKVIRPLSDSQLTPIETAIMFANGGKVLSLAKALIKSVQSGLSFLGLEEVSDVLDFIGLGGIKEDISSLGTFLKLMALVNWLVIIAMIVVGGYSIYAIIANKRSFMWLETVLYGMLLLGYCGFALLMNQTISKALTEYVEVVGKSIRPFNILLWPIFSCVGLLGCAIAEYILFRSTTGVAENTAWICVCGNENPAKAAFCTKCGSKRSGEKIQECGWTCTCGSKNAEEDSFCHACGKGRYDRSPSQCKICGRRILTGGDLCDVCSAQRSDSAKSKVVIRMGGNLRTDGFKKPDDLG